jgi:hypothetical protein
VAPKPPDKKAKSRDQYPKVEERLELLKSTLKALEGKKPNEVVTPPDNFKKDNELNPFAPAGLGEDPRTKGPGGPGGPRIGAGDGGDGNEDKPDPEKTKELEVPEYCLVRVLDVTVKPGKTYEYRMRVRMANPNYQHKNVANPDYAAEDELGNGEWSKMPIRVYIEPELNYYAVDESEVHSAKSKKPYRGPYWNAFVNKDRQVFLQAHKWLEAVSSGDKNNLPLLIGDWAVAERFPVYRGEYAGRSERVELPYWRTNAIQFVIASDATTKRRTPGIRVPFGYNESEGAPNGPEAVVVDFEPTNYQYDRVVQQGGAAKTIKVTDKAGTEVVLFTPDGKLLSLEAARDVTDATRTSRLQDFRDRVKEVKEGPKSQPGKGPFGGG